MADMVQLDLLVCAATQEELAAFGSCAGTSQACFLTGVGIPCALAETLLTAGRLRPQRILNIGIAGAYRDAGFVIGDIVIGISEVYGDIGFELPELPGFRSITESPWGTFYQIPLSLTLLPEFGGARTGRGCTVNSCTGTGSTGQERRTLFNADFETMEGAAVAQAGARLGIPVCEVRAISNFASHREMRPENIRLALASLAAYFQHCRENSHV